MPFMRRLLGPPDVEGLKARGDIRRLVGVLQREQDPVVCSAALRALLEAGHARAAVDVLAQTAPPWAVEPLIALLGHTDKHVRQGAVDALGKIGAPAVEPLIVALGSGKDRWTRQAVARALGRIGDARAADPLTAALHYGKKDLRGAAAEALEQLDWEEDEFEACTPASDEFLRRLQKERLHHRNRRTVFVLHKLAFIAILLGVAAIQMALQPGFRWLLYALPVVGLVYDVYIYDEDRWVRRIGQFICSHSSQAKPCERDWEEYARNRRGPLGGAASPVLTVVAALPCLLDGATGDLLKFAWMGLVVALSAALYLVGRYRFRDRL